MDYIFNKEKLTEVLSDFYNSTGIAITLYDASERLIATSPTYTGCCSMIRTKKRCVENCDQSDLIHMKEVSESRMLHRYTCHAGLMEAILPILYEDVLIAYLQIGQFRDAEQVYSRTELLRESARRYGFCEEELLALYGQVPVISEERLGALCNILEILIRFFWVDGLIYYKRSMLSVRIERYITEHLTERICLEDLCKRFFLSKNAIYRLFHDEFHTTVNGFIIQKRMRLAQECLLAEPNLNVTEISLGCGFQDYNYFIRLFKKQVGMTPLQYRLAHGGKERAKASLP